MDRTRAVEELWRRGNLRWMLNPAQLPVYDFIRGTDNRHIVAAMHRGCGKSYLAALICIEECLKGPDRSVKYVGPTAKMIRSIALPNFRKILASAPRSMLPRYKAMDGLFYFPNGSHVVMAGADAGNSDNLRGTDTHFCVIDEEGFIDDPDYVVNDIILPRALPVDGKILHVSTPPKSSLHAFVRRMQEAEREGYLFRLKVTDNQTLTSDRLAAFIKESGGEHSTTFRREFLCEIVTEEKDAAFPELLFGSLPTFSDITVHAELSPCYVAVAEDLSGQTAAVFGRWDHVEKKLFVERELYVTRTDSESLVKKISDIENELWPTAWGRRVVRFSDADQAVIDDWIRVSGFQIRRPQNLDIVSGVALLRTMISRGEFFVSERCPVTRQQMHGAIWNNSRNDFPEAGDGGRFSGATACVILAKGIMRNLNPLEEFPAAIDRRTHFVPPGMLGSRAAWLKLFGARRHG